MDLLSKVLIWFFWPEEPDWLETIAAEFHARGVRCLPIKCDVTKTEEVEAAAAAVIKEFGKISPGYFETELTSDTLKTEAFTNFVKATVPLGRYGSEGELNPAAIFLASDEVSYITGQNIKVDGGFTSV